ncbi:dynamin central domain-containing protein [Artemisia annua]|uniref:Dynamin central domain-containing protein n=1 Tax=Artemisia annua TaxID=35608 RepID=A0A2U1PE19_ARTAN|nr:dynamin central domain-containing protein [Artemisia annua]
MAKLLVEFVIEVSDFIEKTCISIVSDHCVVFPQFLSTFKIAVETVMNKMKSELLKWVKELIEMEELTPYTCDSSYNTTADNLRLANQECLLSVLDENMENVNLCGLGMVDITYLHNVEDEAMHEDSILFGSSSNTFLMKKAVALDLDDELTKEFNNGGIGKILEEPASTAEMRNHLSKSIYDLENANFSLSATSLSL